jgi:hypothetical protein
MGKDELVNKIVISEDEAFIKSIQGRISQVEFPIDFRYVAFFRSAKTKGRNKLSRKAKEMGADVVFIKKEDPHNDYGLYAGLAVFYKFKKIYGLGKKIKSRAYFLKNNMTNLNKILKNGALGTIAILLATNMFSSINMDYHFIDLRKATNYICSGHKNIIYDVLFGVGEKLHWDG